MKKTVTKSNVCQAGDETSTINVAIPLRVLAALKSAKNMFFSLCVLTGREVLAALMEEERTMFCGPKGEPNAQRQAMRGGHTASRVTLGGRRIEVRRPRVRAVRGAEMSLSSFARAADGDPLDERTMESIAVGVSTRRYARSLDALPQEIAEYATSKSAVSRLFVALSAQRLAAWINRSLAQLHLPVLMIDGIYSRSHVMLIALGIDSDGRKHVLGMRQGSTENATVARELVADVIERGVSSDTLRLVIFDGARALRRRIDDYFGGAVLVQRCQVHKLRNVCASIFLTRCTRA